MLMWVKEGAIPKHAMMAEMPREPDTSDQCLAYSRELVGNMLLHNANPLAVLKSVLVELSVVESNPQTIPANTIGTR